MNPGEQRNHRVAGCGIGLLALAVLSVGVKATWADDAPEGLLLLLLGAGMWFLAMTFVWYGER